MLQSQQHWNARGARLGRSQLVVLQLVEGGMAEPGAITAHLGTTQQWVSKCLLILVGQGCVVAHRNPSDRRCKQFTVTKLGMHATAIARAMTQHFAAYGSADLTEDLTTVLAQVRNDTTLLSDRGSAAA